MTRLTHILLLLFTATLFSACTTTTISSDGTEKPEETQKDLTTLRAERAKAHVDLGMAYFEIGRFNIALSEAETALENVPDYAPAFYLRAIVYSLLKENALARENYERAIRLKPDESDFKNSYGFFLCLQNDTTKGLQLIEQAIRDPLYPHHARAYNNSGQCYMISRNEAAGKAQFQRTLIYEPDNQIALYALADLAFSHGQYTEAQRLLIHLHRAHDPTPQTLWLGIRATRALGNRSVEKSYAEQLRNRFPDSPEYRLLEQGN